MTDFIENYFSGSKQFEPSEIDSQKISKAAISSVLPIILKNDLTERQAICLKLRYVNGMNQIEIAKKLHLSQPTVSRHIIAAKEIVNNRLSYCLAAINKTNSLWIELENSYAV